MKYNWENNPILSCREKGDLHIMAKTKKRKSATLW